QAAQAPRREAVLGDLARGADPAAALGAELAPATRAWLRERSREASGGEPDAASRGASTNSTIGDGAPEDARARARRRWRLPAGWWRYAGGGLAAVLALGVGLRMMLEPAPGPAPDRATVGSTSNELDDRAAALADGGGASSPPAQAMQRHEFAKPARKDE